LEESDSGSITGWIEALKEGLPLATDVLWQHYFEQIVRLAQRRLGGASHRAVEDAEDAALSAFQALYTGALEGRFAQLNDRVDLWRLLTAITINKVLSQTQRHTRLKRGGHPTPGNADSSQPEQESAGAGNIEEIEHALSQAISREPTPEATALIEEQYQLLLAALGDRTLEQIAVWRMEGLSNKEIAGQLRCAVRTVERKLVRIRAVWTECGFALKRGSQRP